MKWMGLALAAAAALLPACAHVSDAATNEELDHQVELYWKAVHWQDAVAGSTFVFTDQRADWLRSHDKQEKSLFVTNWEQQGEKLDKGVGAGTIFVKATWYMLPSVVEQTELVEQRWIHSNGKWLLISEKGGPLPFQ